MLLWGFDFLLVQKWQQVIKRLIHHFIWSHISRGYRRQILWSKIYFRMSQTTSGITKKRRLTGNQRQKLRQSQALLMGTSADELLKQRHSRMAEWQRERDAFKASRCPNCGIFGHPWKWCPFSSNFCSQKGNEIRFRGPYGTWGTEPRITLTPEETRRYRHFFGLLSMPIGPGTWSMNVLDTIVSQKTSQLSLYLRIIIHWLFLFNPAINHSQISRNRSGF